MGSFLEDGGGRWTKWNAWWLSLAKPWPLLPQALFHFVCEVVLVVRQEKRVPQSSLGPPQRAPSLITEVFSAPTIF